MDGPTFDGLARKLAMPGSRRRILLGALSAGVARVLAHSPRARGKGAAQDARPGGVVLIEYFALGDSVASGHGLMDDATPCHRSALSYPFKVAKGLGSPGQVAVAVNHIACSGATAGEPSKPKDPTHWFRSQVSETVKTIRDDIPSDQPVLVSITIGANDFGWLTPAVVSHLVEDDSSFEDWVNETAEAVASEVKAQVAQLLAFANVAVVITQYHNPVNTDSIAFRLTDLVLLTSCQSLFRVQTCYDRTEMAIHTLNQAFVFSVSEALDHPARLKITPTLHERFHGHEGPNTSAKLTCGYAKPGIADTWVQYPGDPASNSGGAIVGAPSLVGGSATEFTGDCFHPNEDGAQIFAEEVIAAARRALKPQIIEVPSVTEESSSSVTIRWVTDRPTSAVVEYGRTTSYGRSRPRTPDQTATEHQVLLDNLDPGQTYHFRVQSDFAGQEVVSEDQVFSTQPVCSPDQQICDDACVDPDSDPAHCGGCDNACADDSSCVAGVCSSTIVGVCAPGSIDECGPYVGVEGYRYYCSCSTSTEGDGICIFTFGTNASCKHHNPCGSTTDCEPGEVCVDACGEPLCFLACDSIDEPVAAACSDGYMECSGDCIDPLSDPYNCGGCGTICAAGCISGSCDDCSANGVSCGEHCESRPTLENSCACIEYQSAMECGNDPCYSSLDCASADYICVASPCDALGRCRQICLSDSGSGSCFAANESCSEDADCCDGYACFQFSDQPYCSPACGSDSDCSADMICCTPFLPDYPFCDHICGAY